MRRGFSARGGVCRALVGLVTVTMLVSLNAQRPMPLKAIDVQGMSPIGQRAASRARAPAQAFLRARGLAAAEPVSTMDADECDDNGCDPGGNEKGNGPGATQSEVAIAVDSTGSHVVIGFNDSRGFARDPQVAPTSISGYAYSDDGGATFVDGGQLPSGANGQVSDGTKLPQVFGDPDVKYVPGGGGCQFIYSSSMVKGFVGP